jgi:hypothetical protein
MVPYADRQIQLILCTNKLSSLVICYLPSGVEVLWAIGEILKIRKLIHMPESRFVFIDENK